MSFLASNYYLISIREILVDNFSIFIFIFINLLSLKTCKIVKLFDIIKELQLIKHNLI